MSTDAWFREFEREEAKRMERIDIIRGEQQSRALAEAREHLTRAIKADEAGPRWLIPEFLTHAADALRLAGRPELADEAEALSGRIGICGADIERLYDEVTR